MKPLHDMTIDELEEYRRRVNGQWEENRMRYDRRYSDSYSDYATSINDDYNGEGEEFTQLTLLLTEINREIQKRPPEPHSRK